MSARFSLTDRDRFLPSMALLTLLGLWLRWKGAQGDLWLDEIWSLSLLKDLPSAAAVFGVHHANNHYLNSLWMYAVGQNAPVLIYRLPAILFGAASVPMVGLILKREGQAAAIAGMALIAVADIMVEYGSQARGYSGMIFFELLALLHAGRMLEGEGRGRNHASWKLAVSLVLGLLCHLTMLLAVGGIVLWVLQAQRKKYENWRSAVATTLRLLMPSILLIGALASYLFGTDSTFALGHHDPYDPVSFWRAYAMLLLIVCGIVIVTPATCFLANAVVFGGLAGEIASGGKHAWLYAAFLIGVPLAYSCAGLPNSAIIRFFLPCGVVFILWLAHLFGIGLRQGGSQRNIASIGLAAILTLNMVLLGQFYRYGRGDYTGLLRGMAINGTIRYATNQQQETALVMEYYGSRLGIATTAVSQADWCGGAADWFILAEAPSTTPIENLAQQVSHDCGFGLTRRSFPTHSLSSLNWKVYRVDR